jgi:putative component of toxin-antitoxin plasmid stabilization module
VPKDDAAFLSTGQTANTARRAGGKTVAAEQGSSDRSVFATHNPAVGPRRFARLEVDVGGRPHRVGKEPNALTGYRKNAIAVSERSMPSIHVVFYQENNGEAPVVDWLRGLRRSNAKAFLKCRAAITRLALLGHELRRPEGDYLRDGIYELRVRLGSVHYRLLYFFHGRTISVVSHGLTKEAAVPRADIERAIVRQALFTANPTIHTFTGEIDDA